MGIMTSGRFNKFPSDMEALTSNIIGFSSSKEQHDRLLSWFESGKITKANGQAIQGTSINVNVRHTMIRKIFGSPHISPKKKAECWSVLANLDSSDMLGRTEKFCEAANPNPASKRKAFNEIFNNKDIGL